MAFFTHLSDMLLHFDFKEVYHQKVSKTLLNVFILFFALFIIISVKFYFDFSSGFNQFESFMRGVPYFTIKNGELNVEDVSQPFELPAEKSKFIIDTTGNTDQSVLNDVETGILVTKTKIFTKANYEVQSFDLTVINEMSGLYTVTRNDITSWIMGLKPVSYFLILSIISLYQLFAKAIAILILSLILMAVAGAKKIKITYSTLFNISAYVFLLPIFFYWLDSLFGIHMPLFFLFYWAVAIIYGYKGVKNYDVPPTTEIIA